jgi:hypothetical protein
MAEAIVTAGIGPALTHKQAVEKHSNSLFDAVALLDAAAERIDAATPLTTDDPERANTMHNTMRLVLMAMSVVKEAAEDMGNTTDATPEVRHG